MAYAVPASRKRYRPGEKYYRVTFGSGVIGETVDVTATDPVNALCAAVSAILHRGTLNGASLIAYIRHSNVWIRPIKEVNYAPDHSER